MVATVKEERREVAVVSLSHKACVWGPRLWGPLFLHVSARNPMGLAANPVQNFVLAAICLAVLRMQQVGNHSGMLKGYKTRGSEARCAVWLVCPVPQRCRSQPSLTGKCSFDRACDSVCSHSGAVSQTFSHQPSFSPTLPSPQVPYACVSRLRLLVVTESNCTRPKDTTERGICGLCGSPAPVDACPVISISNFHAGRTKRGMSSRG